MINFIYLRKQCIVCSMEYTGIEECSYPEKVKMRTDQNHWDCIFKHCQEEDIENKERAIEITDEEERALSEQEAEDKDSEDQPQETKYNSDNSGVFYNVPDFMSEDEGENKAPH